MKRFSFFLVFLFSISLIFSYSSPPLESVLQYNQDISSSLFDLVYMGEQGTIGYSYNIQLLSISPSVDDRIPSSGDKFVFWTAKLSYFNAYGNCGGKKFKSQNIQYSFKFDFMNNSQTVSGSSSSIPDIPLYIQIPFSEEELDATRADEKIQVNLLWDATVTFRECQQMGSGFTQYCDCKDVPYSLSGNDSMEYYVDGGHIVHFLSKPVLNEQWYQNNHFDSIITSNRKFYKAQIELDGKTLVYFRLYNFSILNNEYGLQYITSHETCSNCSDFAEFHNFIYPYLIDETNSTYAFIYQFNSTYEALGKHNLSLVISDYFDNTFTFSESILSTMLTYKGNISELGEEITKNEKYRESAEFVIQDLNLVLIPASILSLLIIISLFRVRL